MSRVLTTKFLPSLFSIDLSLHFRPTPKHLGTNLIVAGGAPLGVPGAHIGVLSTSIAALVLEQRLDVHARRRATTIVVLKSG